MKLSILLLFLCMSSLLHAEDIISVLESSANLRFSQFVRVDRNDPDAVALHRAFDKVMKATDPGTPALQLHVIDGPLMGDSVFGNRIIVFSRELARQPEEVQLFVFAHEIGHVVLGHWAELAAV